MRLQPHPVTVPAPHVAPETAPFWAGCQVHELRHQRCSACGAAHMPPVTICTACDATELTWAASSGAARVYSWSVVWRPPTKAYAVPYAVAILDVEESYQMLGNVIGCEPEELRIGMPVVVSFHPVQGGFLVPYFMADHRKLDNPLLVS